MGRKAKIVQHGDAIENLHRREELSPWPVRRGMRKRHLSHDNSGLLVPNTPYLFEKLFFPGGLAARLMIRRAMCALILGIVAVVTFGIFLPPSAMARPDPVVRAGDVATATEDQSAGIASGKDPNFDSPPVNTLNVNTLSGPIQPAESSPGIYFHNSSGGNVVINSGTDKSSVVIHTKKASGIDAESQGTPTADAPEDPFLGIPIPGDPAVSGGVVQIQSYSDIETEGDDAHGIFARSNSPGYPGTVTDKLKNFSDANISFFVTSVKNPDGSPAAIDQPVQGQRIDAEGNPVPGNGGTFVLNADGTYSFDPGTDFNDLALNQSRSSMLNYGLSGNNTKTGGSDNPLGTLVVTVTKTDTGLTQAHETYFPVYGVRENSATDPNKTVFPNLKGYVDDLLASAKAGSEGASVTVTSTGKIKTVGKTSTGIFAQSLGGTGKRGRDGAWDHGSSRGGTGNMSGNVTVTASGSINTGGAESAGIAAISWAGDGGKGGDGGTWRYGARGGTGGNGGDIEVHGSADINTSGDFTSGIIAASTGGNGGNGA